MEPRPTARDVHDLRAMVLATLRELEQAAALRLVQVRVALPEELIAATAMPDLQDTFRAVLEAAIGRATGGAVLVTGQRSGAVLEVSILDDGPPRSREALLAALRPDADRLAAHGCALDVPAGDAGGSTVVLRVPAGGMPAPLAWERPRPGDVRLPRPFGEG
ncbi:MAG: hypothetical protein J0H19_06230 [Rhodospirillales bacterium]|nr:hypothetical protein [Rhodospirillales bacterium]